MQHKSLEKALKKAGAIVELVSTSDDRNFYRVQHLGYIVAWNAWKIGDGINFLKMIRENRLKDHDPQSDYCAWFFPNTIKEVIANLPIAR